MATLKQVRDKADAKLVTFWQTLVQKQNAYYAKHGKYFQLLVTGGKGVENGEEYNFTAIPAEDEKHIIDIDTAWTENIPFEIEIHEWVGAGDDIGYKAIVMVEYQSIIYRRERNSNNVDTGWFIYDPTSLDKK